MSFKSTRCLNIRFTLRVIKYQTRYPEAFAHRTLNCRHFHIVWDTRSNIYYYRTEIIEACFCIGGGGGVEGGAARAPPELSDHKRGWKKCFGSGWIRVQFGPGSGSGFWIQMSKNRFDKPKFTMTDSIFNPLNTRTEKCSN